MNQTVEQWLADRASPPGTLACGVRNPDGQCACRGADENCPPEKMAMLLQQLDDPHQSLFNGSLSPRWHTWTFDGGQIRFVLRPDGWLFGLAVRAESGAVSSLDPLSAEFLALKPDA